MHAGTGPIGFNVRELREEPLDRRVDEHGARGRGLHGGRRLDRARHGTPAEERVDAPLGEGNDLLKYGLEALLEGRLRLRGGVVQDGNRSDDDGAPDGPEPHGLIVARRIRSAAQAAMSLY